MSEKSPTQEKAPNSQKHSSWVKKAKLETGALTMGAVGGIVGMNLLLGLGLLNPGGLFLGTVAAAIAAYKFTKSNP